MDCKNRIYNKFSLILLENTAKDPVWNNPNKHTFVARFLFFCNIILQYVKFQLKLTTLATAFSEEDNTAREAIFG